MGSRNSKRNKRRKNKRKALPSFPNESSIQLACVGLAGIPQCIVARPHYRNPDDPRNLGGPVGLPGEYKAVFVFGRPGFPLLPENQYSPAERLEGDSHLAITKPAHSDPNNLDADQIRLYAQTPDGSFVFTGHPNTKGFLGKMELSAFTANDSKDARLKAHRVLASALSSVSLYLDIPLHVYQTDITELRTGMISMSVPVSYNEIPLYRIPAETITDEFRGYASLYREALTSNSPSIEFLCYYKIVEGIRKRQARLRREAKARGETVAFSPKQTIPDKREEQISWLNSIVAVPRKWDDMALDQVFLQCTLGRRVFDVVDKEIRGLRNRIAHFILDSGEPTILIDEGEDINLVLEWLPLTRCITRFLMRTEFPDAFNG